MTCAVCGRATDRDEPLLAWMLDTDYRGESARTCPECAREHVRAIEAKLEQQWW